VVELNNGMKKAINQLTQQIISSSVYQNFVEKRNTLTSNPEFSSLFQKLEERREFLDRIVDDGENITDDDLEEIEQIIEQLLTDPLFVDYFEAEDELVSLLEQINDELSSLLGFDFASSVFLSRDEDDDDDEEEEEEGEEFWE